MTFINPNAFVGPIFIIHTISNFGKNNELLYLHRQHLEIQSMALSRRKLQYLTSFPKNAYTTWYILPGNTEACQQQEQHQWITPDRTHRTLQHIRTEPPLVLYHFHNKGTIPVAQTHITVKHLCNYSSTITTDYFYKVLRINSHIITSRNEKHHCHKWWSPSYNISLLQQQTNKQTKFLIIISNISERRWI